MDVRCGRCGTEYEFDDALVSERGTTVKCTNCGHQFRIKPPEKGIGAPERWVVRTAQGRELVYTSLRELQRGIAQRQVAPEDLLSRGNQPPRPLGSIAELEPFFHARAMPAPRTGAMHRTLAGVAPPPNVLAATAPAAERPPAPPDLRRTAPLDPGAPPGPTAASPPPDAEPPTARVATAPPRPSKPEFEPEPPTLPRTERVDDPPVEASLTPTPSAVRDAMLSYSDLPPDDKVVAPSMSRRSGSRWVVGVVLVGAVVVIGATVGRRYLEGFVRGGEVVAQASDARVQELLTKANEHLEGADYEAAREQLDKASALAENDPAVLRELARLEALRADLLWLRLRLLDPKSEQLVQATHRQLGARVGRAEQAVERAKQHAAEDPSVKRAEIDVLRLAGKLERARQLVAAIAERATEPENAYVLAALDLADKSPVLSSVVERLRAAAAPERGLGRSRALLVYALVRDGQLAAAATELSKAGDRAKSHPLFDELESFIQRHQELADAGTDAALEVATVDPSTLPMLDTTAGANEEHVDTGNFRAQLTQAASAVKKGDLDRAEKLYKAVLASQPGNTEALSGLGDVARLKRDPDTAKEMYEKVLEKNPSYLPALVASADQKWDSGDRKGAIAIYRRVLEQAGASTSYGQHAAARIAQGEGAPAGSPPSTTAQPDPPKDDKPEIDTTDLPEHGP